MPLLNGANAVLLGNTPVDAIYARDSLVWPSGPPPIPYEPYGTPWNMTTPAPVPLLDHGGRRPASGWSHSWNGTKVTINVPPADPDFGDLWQQRAYFHWPAAASPHPNAEAKPPFWSALFHTRWAEMTGLDPGIGRRTGSFEVAWNETTPADTNPSFAGYSTFAADPGPLDHPWIEQTPWYFVIGGTVGQNRAPGFWTLGIDFSTSGTSTQPEGGTITLDTALTTWQMGVEIQ